MEFALHLDYATFTYLLTGPGTGYNEIKHLSGCMRQYEDSLESMKLSQLGFRLEVVCDLMIADERQSVHIRIWVHET